MQCSTVLYNTDIALRCNVVQYSSPQQCEARARDYNLHPPGKLSLNVPECPDNPGNMTRYTGRKLWLRMLGDSRKYINYGIFSGLESLIMLCNQVCLAVFS